MNLPLTFLNKGEKYTAKIYKDGEGADFLTNPYPITIVEQEVTSETVLQINQAAGGGTAIILTPQITM